MSRRNLPTWTRWLGLVLGIGYLAAGIGGWIGDVTDGDNGDLAFWLLFLVGGGALLLGLLATGLRAEPRSRSRSWGTSRRARAPLVGARADSGDRVRRARRHAGSQPPSDGLNSARAGRTSDVDDAPTCPTRRTQHSSPSSAPGWPASARSRALRGRRPEQLRPLDLMILSAATFRASRTVAHDEVLSFLRQPFVRGEAHEGTRDRSRTAARVRRSASCSPAAAASGCGRQRASLGCIRLHHAAAGC